MSLRSSLIRLAHSNPALREHLLPLLKGASAIPYEIGRSLVDVLRGVRTSMEIPPKHEQWLIRFGYLTEEGNLTSKGKKVGLSLDNPVHSKNPPGIT